MTTHVGVLPRDVLVSLLAKLNDDSNETSSLRFLRLPHPRTAVPSLFLPYTSPHAQKTSILEVQAISPPNPRSWFMSEGSVIQNGKLLVMTPVDPMFLLIPILKTTVPTEGGQGTFRPVDDMLETATEKFIALFGSVYNERDPASQISKEDIRRFLALDCAYTALKRVCEVKEITPEITVYRYSTEKVLTSAKSKVARLNNPELFGGSRTLIRNLAKDGLMEDGKEHLLQAGRLRTACDLVSQYLPRDIYNALLTSYDFHGLDAYMKDIQDEAASIAAAKMDKAEARESKTSTKDTNAEKKRKGPALAKASSGVAKLKKANTTGMAKISTFFQAKNQAS